MTFAPTTLVNFYCGPRHGVSVRADAIESAHWFLPWTTIIGSWNIYHRKCFRSQRLFHNDYFLLCHWLLFTVDHSIKILESAHWFIRNLAYNALLLNLKKKTQTTLKFTN